MIKEYYKFIKDYLKLSNMKLGYFIAMFVTALGYKIFLLLNTLFASWIIKYATINDLKMTYISLLLLAVSYLLYKLIFYLNVKFMAKNINYCYRNLQTRLLNKLVTIDDKFTDHISKGKLINSINADILDISNMFDQITEFLSTLLQIIITCIIISLYSGYVSLIFLVFSFIYISIKNYADKKSSFYLKKEKYQLDRYSNLFSQVLSGMQEIKTFNILPKLKIKLNEIKNKYSKNYIKKRNYITLRENDIRFITHGFKILLYVILILLMIYQGIRIDVLVLVISYFDTIVSYLDILTGTTAAIREVNVSVERVNNILNYKSNNEIIYGNIYNDNINGIIEFKNVYFGYDSKNIINGINLRIDSNCLTTIVGQSGTGKTSLFNMLLRLYKPNKGKILIDGVDIFDYSKESYKTNISVVNQRPFIFNMSIKKNLGFVDPNIEHQKEACKKVGIHDFIMSLPKGYNTVLRENANNISGGQKQLISLARTLLSKSEIILFDEITSSLDPDTSDNIKLILKNLKKGHTVLMITHNVELMKISDRIIVMHDGKVVGDGKHKELLENNEYYRKLLVKNSPSKIGVFNND